MGVPSAKVNGPQPYLRRLLRKNTSCLNFSTRRFSRGSHFTAFVTVRPTFLPRWSDGWMVDFAGAYSGPALLATAFLHWTVTLGAGGPTSIAKAHRSELSGLELRPAKNQSGFCAAPGCLVGVPVGGSSQLRSARIADAARRRLLARRHRNIVLNYARPHRTYWNPFGKDVPVAVDLNELSSLFESLVGRSICRKT